MKILSAKQIREADEYTIEHEPVSSINLMERAAGQLCAFFENHYSSLVPVHLFCGMGNNGGDGLALARMLTERQYQVKVYVIRHSGSGGSEDFNSNLRLLEQQLRSISWIKDEKDIPQISGGIVVDAMLGSGLNKPLKGLLSDVVKALNQIQAIKVAIDIPTGMPAGESEEIDPKKIFRANVTLTFQLPKLSFFLRDMAPLTGEVKVLDINLHPAYIHSAPSDYYHFAKADAREIFIPRKKNSYKGTYGHALILAGSTGKTGAAILCSRATMKAGAGMLTTHIPASGVVPLHTSIPEAMLSIDEDQDIITQLPGLENYKALAMGPGIGKDERTAVVLKRIIQDGRLPMVLDADALNILSANPTWLSFLPPGTILTPHIGEFRRLLGVEKLGMDYISRLREFSIKHRIITILKDSITAIAGANGHVFFVNEGSPALATAGSGDVLTGIIVALLANGYKSIDAALLGVWLHGQAGSKAGNMLSQEGVLAGDILDFLPNAFRELY